MLSPPESGEVQPDLNALTTGDATPPFPRATINARLIAIVLTLAVPLNIVVVAVILSLVSAANETQRASLLYSARSIAAAVDAELGKYIALAQVLSHSPTLLEDGIDAFEGELRRGLSADPELWAVVADVSGRLLVNTTRLRGQPLLSPARSNEGLAAQNEAFETRSVVVSDVFLGPDQRWAATANIPVFKNGQPFRALAITMHTRRFLDLVAFQEMPKNWVVAIRDTQGRLVVRLPDHDRRVGQLAYEQVRTIMKQDGLFELVSQEGDQVILANAHSNVSGWTAGIAAKTADLRAAVLGTVGWAIALGGIISLLSLMFALWIARRITRPLAELREKAGALLTDPQVGRRQPLPQRRDAAKEREAPQSDHQHLQRLCRPSRQKWTDGGSQCADAAGHRRSARGRDRQAVRRCALLDLFADVRVDCTVPRGRDHTTGSTIRRSRRRDSMDRFSSNTVARRRWRDRWGCPLGLRHHRSQAGRGCSAQERSAISQSLRTCLRRHYFIGWGRAVPAMQPGFLRPHRLFGKRAARCAFRFPHSSRRSG